LNQENLDENNKLRYLNKKSHKVHRYYVGKKGIGCSGYPTHSPIHTFRVNIHQSVRMVIRQEARSLPSWKKCDNSQIEREREIEKKGGGGEREG
jgi:hypothetical protein